MCTFSIALLITWFSYSLGGFFVPGVTIIYFVPSETMNILAIVSYRKSLYQVCCLFFLLGERNLNLMAMVPDPVCYRRLGGHVFS